MELLRESDKRMSRKKHIDRSYLRYLLSKIVFQCRSCNSTFYAGDDDEQGEIDKLLEGVCIKCGGKVVFKERY